MKHYIYTGCFLDKNVLNAALEELNRQPLSRIIEFPHVTTEFRPTEPHVEWFGTPITVLCVGYASDGENEGLLAEVHSEHEGVNRLLNGVPVPHITLSVSREGKPVNTARLKFDPISPIPLQGVFGGFCGETGRPECE